MLKEGFISQISFMQTEFYSLPLSLHLIMKRQEHPKVTPLQSVVQHLHLLLTTAFGEFSGDESYGCGIWDHDFDVITSSHKLKEIIRQSLLKVIQEKEKRLTNVRIELNIVQEEIPDVNGIQIKKKISISITGILQLTNERLQFRDAFYVGPLSYF